jgi:hypothetical protein
MKKFLIVSLTVAAASVSFAQAPTAKQAFAQLKKLAGTWEMKGPTGETMKVHYKVSGAGNTLIETQFPGDPHEMVSVYHMDGNKLMMTHYCAAGNQPTMVYKPGKDGKVLSFDFVRGSNMKLTDMHIHAAKIKLIGPNQIESDWIGWMNGKKGPTTTFELKRVVEPAIK